MKKINVLGTSIKNYTLPESLGHMYRFLTEGSMNTILYLNSPLLMAAGRDEKIRDWIESADMTVCGDLETLRSYGDVSKRKMRETADFSFLRRVLQKLASRKESVYLISESEEELESLQTEILLLQPDTNITGRSLFGDDQDQNARTLNEINALVPSLILMRASYDNSMRLMEKDRIMVNAQAMIAFPRELNIAFTHEPLSIKLKKLIYKRAFRKQISSYEKEQTQKSSQKNGKKL